MKKYDIIMEGSKRGIYEDPKGKWIKWEDVKGLAEDIDLESHDGYARTKDIATGMAVSLHQRFYADAATFRFIFKHSEPIIIDVDMDAFKKFMETNTMGKLEHVENLQSQAFETGYFTGENTEKVRAAGYRQPEGILEIKAPECNCGEMLAHHSYSWICPAHGYKRR